MMLFSIVPLLAFGAVAVAAEPAACPRTRCFDAVNACGVKYGGCYDMCTQQMPSAPPCASITSTASVSTTSSASVCTSTGTACVDILKSCGSPPTAVLTYGGCFPACGPTPTFTPPPCPTASATDLAAPTV
ncbi:hypothetical protein F4819DRAFT_446029 [Hypoxylon fuscum]|nr:hypothetical protein F4819DRAFT_446029 [Hypoxylon fuscum]